MSLINFQKIIKHFNSNYINEKHKNPEQFKETDEEKYAYYNNNKIAAQEALKEFLNIPKESKFVFRRIKTL